MLDGKVVLVTGGSSGIGKAISLRFARDGGRVAVVASSSLSKAEATAKEIEAAGGQARAYAADVRDPSTVAELVRQVEADLGPVKVLVTAAGVFLPSPVGETEAGVFDAMVDTNLKGVFHCISAVVPGMKAAGEGTIITFSSVAAIVGVRSHAVYCATKAAVSMMTRALALDLAPFDININAIAPGNTATPMNEAMRTDPAQAGFLQALATATPSTRTFSAPEDIAELALFLTTPAARAMHGSTLLADEGLSAGI